MLLFLDQNLVSDRRKKLFVRNCFGSIAVFPKYANACEVAHTLTSQAISFTYLFHSLFSHHHFARFLQLLLFWMWTMKRIPNSLPIIFTRILLDLKMLNSCQLPSGLVSSFLNSYLQLFRRVKPKRKMDYRFVVINPILELSHLLKSSTLRSSLTHYCLFSKTFQSIDLVLLV